MDILERVDLQVDILESVDLLVDVIQMSYQLVDVQNGNWHFWRWSARKSTCIFFWRWWWILALEWLCIGIHGHMPLVTKMGFSTSVTNINSSPTNCKSIARRRHTRIVKNRWWRWRFWRHSKGGWWHPVAKFLLHKLVSASW